MVVVAVGSLTKKCRTCGRDLPRSQFYRAAANKDGLRGDCKKCANRTHAEYAAAHRKDIAERAARWRERKRGGPRHCDCGAVLVRYEKKCSVCKEAAAKRYCSCGVEAPPRLHYCHQCWEESHTRRCACGCEIPHGRQKCDSCVLAEYLPWAYRRAAYGEGFTMLQLAKALVSYHPDGKEVTRQMLDIVLNRKAPCPVPMRKGLDEILGL